MYTLDIGGFMSKETILKCSCDDSVYVPEELQWLVPHKCTFGFDVMVYVGKALFVQCLGEQEIIKKMKERNIMGGSYIFRTIMTYTLSKRWSVSRLGMTGEYYLTPML